MYISEFFVVFSETHIATGNFTVGTAGDHHRLLYFSAYNSKDPFQWAFDRQIFYHQKTSKLLKNMQRPLFPPNRDFRVFVEQPVLHTFQTRIESLFFKGSPQAKIGYIFMS